MPRVKVFERNINLPITASQLERIETVLEGDTGEGRVGFIRLAIEEELQRREQRVRLKRKRRAS